MRRVVVSAALERLLSTPASTTAVHSTPAALRASVGALLLSRRLSTSTSHGSSSTTPHELSVLEAVLQSKAARLAELHAVQQVCRSEAHRHPDRYAFAGFVFLFAQAVILFDWTYVHFDWNLVEPITYLLGYSATWIALAWYGNMQEEFGFDSIRKMLEVRKLEALYAAKGLDVKELERLEVEVERLRRMLQGRVAP